MNVSSVVQQKLMLDMNIEQYDEATVKAELATLYGVAAELIELTAEAGSVGLTVTIRAADGGTGDDSTAIVATAASINTISSDALARSLGVAVSNMSGAQAVPAQAAGCGEGYGGPYCAVCATGWYGGGEGKTCAACADAGDPTLTIAIQGGVAFGALVVVTLLMLKFGKKAISAAATAAAGEEVGIDVEAETGLKQDEAKGGKAKGSKAGRTVACLKKIGGFISSFGVKMKVRQPGSDSGPHKPAILANVPSSSRRVCCDDGHMQSDDEGVPRLRSNFCALAQNVCRARIQADQEGRRWHSS